jgi:hypothetical protein
MDPQLLKAANLTLSKCGRPKMPQGLSCIPLHKAYLMQFFFPATPTQTTQTLQKEITAPAKGLVIPEAWALRSIQSSQPASMLLQVQLPDGRFLFSNPIAISNLSGFGSSRFVFTHEKEFPLGSKLQITVQDTNTSAVQSLALLFEGSYKYYLKADPGVCLDDGGCDARYPGTPNQNILAPAWMQGYAPASSQGCIDIEDFTYASDIQTLTPTGSSSTATAQVQLDPSTDFAMRRMFFSIIPAAGVTAYNILIRARNGSGFALHDDFVLSSYIANSPMPHDWELAAGEQIFFDLQLVDYVGGGGNVSVQCFMEGPKRGKR